jgi:hypothetical protein
MGIRNYNDGGAISIDSMPLRYADDVIDNLSHGKPVAREAVDKAKETLIEQIWSNKASAAAVTRKGVAVLYAIATDAAERGELIGELVAAGTPAKQILNEVFNLDPTSSFSQGEKDLLIKSLDEPVKDRFATVVNLYVDAFKFVPTTDGGSQKDGDHRGPFPHRPSALLQGQRQAEGSDEDRRATPDGDGPRPDEAALSDLIDSSKPMDTRLDRAMEMGGDAIPALFDLLQSNNQVDQEFAFVALTHLGQTRDAGPDVYRAAHRLEGNLEFKEVAEQIRRSVKGAGGNDDLDFHSRDRAKRANISDRWLRSAFAGGDAPSIMRAAAGREVLAIPMLVAELVKRRRR